MSTKHKKTKPTKHPKTQQQRTERLEQEIVKLAINFARTKQNLEARVKQLEEDKTELIAEIQKAKTAPVYIPYSAPNNKPWHPCEPGQFPQWRITCKY